MVGRHDQKWCVQWNMQLVFGICQSQADGWRRVATDRLTDDMQGNLTSDLLKGVLDKEQKILTSHRNDVFGVNQRLCADIRASQQRFATARQAQELLRVQLTRHGPQPRTAASSQN